MASTVMEGMLKTMTLGEAGDLKPTNEVPGPLYSAKKRWFLLLPTTPMEGEAGVVWGRKETRRDILGKTLKH